MGRGMEMDGCGKIMQILLFAANFIIWLGSIVILVLGIWAVVDRPYLETVLGETIYISAAYILIGVGVFTFLISFLGCFGAIKEIKCMLLLYFIIVLLLFVILLVGGILGFVFHGQAAKKIKMGMLKSMKEYEANDLEKPTTKSWDEAQRAMKCCGIEKFQDWAENNKDFKSSAKQVPTSCCRMNEATGQLFPCESGPHATNTYDQGCYHVSKEFVMEHAIYIGAAGIVVAVLMLFGLVFSIILFQLIN